MSMVNVKFNDVTGKIKAMHGVNNGPIIGRSEQVRGNFSEFKAAKIPYVRNHDASFCSAYGGEHTVDVHAIFPNFDADPYDPASYDFTYTDIYTKSILDTGAEVYYRFGSKIEHGVKKYGTLVPKDFKKWAIICEHIIRHYNEGWADGFCWNIKYWEIWNEPDGYQVDGNKPNWAGTPEEFYELYSVAAVHLKACFPELYIGGPSMSGPNEPWLRGFLEYLAKCEKYVPVDFLGFHLYEYDIHGIAKHDDIIRSVLDEYGYKDCELHINEWNYLTDWTMGFVKTVQEIISMRGAAYVAAFMCHKQKQPIDKLMYYDARPSTFNGMFDFYTLKPLKGYYPFVMFSKLYDLANEVYSSTDEDNLFVAAASDGNRRAAMIVNYNIDKNDAPKNVEIKLNGLGNGKLRYYLLDEYNTMCEIAFPENGCIVMQPDSVLLIADFSINN